MLEKPYLIDLIALYYLPLKAIHILFVIAWMAGIMYLPRLFAYHARHADNPHLYGVFLTMEQRLLRIIMLPAMIGTFVFGTLLLWVPGLIAWDQGWIHLKLVLVFALAGFHGLMVSWWKAFLHQRNTHSEKFFRLMNEVPFFLTIGIVFLVVLKSF